MLLFKIMIIAAAIWLKTDHAKTFLAQTLIDVFKNEFGLVAKIDNINISLPLIADIDSFLVMDQGGEIGSIKNVHINILPSLFSIWEVTFWSISAEELTLNRVPQIKVNPNESSRLFNPAIIIRKLSFNQVNIAPALTGLSRQFSFSLNSHVEYNNARQQ